jgi:hypothetical protein
VLWAFKTDLNPGKSAFKTGFVTCILKVENWHLWVFQQFVRTADIEQQVSQKNHTHCLYMLE